MSNANTILACLLAYIFLFRPVLWHLHLVVSVFLYFLTLSSVTIGCLDGSDLCHYLHKPCPLFFPLLPDTLQLCSVHLHFPESKDCNRFLTLLPDVASLPTQLPTCVNLLCRGQAKHREDLDRGPSLGVWIICLVVTLSWQIVLPLLLLGVSSGQFVTETLPIPDSIGWECV